MGLVVFLTCLVTVVAATSYWVHQTVLDTNRYVETVTPIAKDPAVAEALSVWMAEQLLIVVDARKVIADALPEQARILAGPLASAVRTFVQEQIDRLLRTEAFTRAWRVANTAAHATAVAIVRDETRTDVVRTSQGRVVLNLLPLLNEGLRQLQQASPDILGREVRLPEITADEIPAESRQKVEQALGVKIPANFGEIVLFSSKDLETAQDAVSLSDRLVVLLIIAAVAMIAFTVWVSTRRRRTVIQLGIGIAVAFVVVRRLIILSKDMTLDNIKDDVYRQGADAGVSEVLGRYLGFSAWLIFLAVVAAIVAFVWGPYPRAAQLRQGAHGLLRGAASEVAKAGAEYQDEPLLQWLRSHHLALQVAPAVAVFLVVLVFDLSLAWLVFLFVLLAAFEFVLYFLTVGRARGQIEVTEAGDAIAELEPTATAEVGPGEPDRE